MLGLSNAEFGDLLIDVAKANDDAKRLDRASALYTQAISAIEVTAGSNSPKLIDPLSALARVEKARGRLTEAKAAAARSADIAKTVYGADHPATRFALAALAEVSSSAEKSTIATKVAALEAKDRTANETDKLAGQKIEAMGAPSGEAVENKCSEQDPGKATFERVKVYYETTRVATGHQDPKTFYGAEDASASYGITTVSVPCNRPLGSVPRESIWNFEFRPDPNKHLVLESVTPYSGEGAFLSNLKTQIGATKRKEALVYIHGFANSFEDAAIHTAQLATDLELDGAPVLYSWPSSGSVISYDRALWLSQQIQGYPRAGDASAPVVLAGLDTVDTTKASGGLIGHDDFSGSALNDFQSVIWLSLLPKDRCLLAPQKFGANMTYWSFTTDKCAEPVFMAAITMLRRIGQSETVKLLKNQIELATKAGMQTDAARWKDVLALVQVIQP